MKIARAGGAEVIVFLSLNLQVREVFVAVAVIIRELKQPRYDGDKKATNLHI